MSAKAWLNLLAERDQPVIGTEGKQDENDNDAEDDPAGHGNKLLMQ